jgi:N-acetyl-beta-hexosaminidase
LHALETLSQLCSFDRLRRRHVVVAQAAIKDSPKYNYRGLLLDTGRNYFPVASLERIIDGLAYDKLNVLHWHMNEQQSFPFVSKSVPQLTKYGAYSKE